MFVLQLWRYGEQITSLDLRDNGLQELPDRLAILSNLRSLLLDRNQLTYIAYALHRLTGLMNLSLADNVLYDPPQV